MLGFLFFYPLRMYNLSISPYFMSEEGEEDPFICSAARENGMRRCHQVPPYTEGEAECSLPASPQSLALIGSTPAAGGASVNGCINWNQYYNVCRPGELNPHKGAVNFDNIGYAWIAIFQVRSGKNVPQNTPRAGCERIHSQDFFETLGLELNVLQDVLLVLSPCQRRPWVSKPALEEPSSEKQQRSARN